DPLIRRRRMRRSSRFTPLRRSAEPLITADTASAPTAVLAAVPIRRANAPSEFDPLTESFPDTEAVGPVNTSFPPALEAIVFLSCWLIAATISTGLTDFGSAAPDEQSIVTGPWVSN